MPVAMIGGPLLGGFITDNLSWRWAFYVNIPVGLIALAVIAVTLKLPVTKTQHKIDYLGAALITAGISALVLLTTWGGNEYAWGSWRIVSLAIAGVLALTAFVAVERRAAEPILPLSLFRDRNFVVVSAIGFLLGFALFGATTFLPQYQQMVQGASATDSGLLLTPLMLSAMVVSVISGRVITRTGRYKVFPVLGGAVMTVGAALLATIDAHTSQWQLSLYMIVFGLGMGALMNVVTLVSQNSVSKDDIGVASSSATFFRQIGGSFGTALFGAIFASRLQDTLTSSLGAAGGALTSTQGALQPSMLGKLPAPVRDAFVNGVANATSSVFAVGAILTVAVFALAWFIKEVPLRGNESDDAPAPGAHSESAPADDRVPALA
jgi:EmrB/QacA subfamily drug resistance transporter